MTELDIFWGAYEIMGVALVDMNVWKWMYANPEATPEKLKNAVKFRLNSKFLFTVHCVCAFRDNATSAQ